MSETEIKTIVTTNCAQIEITPHAENIVKVSTNHLYTARDLRELSAALVAEADALEGVNSKTVTYTVAAQPPALTPQDAKVIKHLNRRGSISSLEAMDGYRIRRLAASIFRLKANGYEFKKVMKQDATGQRYARYYVDATPERIAA